MIRSVRSFSMDLSVQVLLDDVISRASWLSLLLPADLQNPAVDDSPPLIELDSAGLRRSDYDILKPLARIPKSVIINDPAALTAALNTYFWNATLVELAAYKTALTECKAASVAAFRESKKARRMWETNKRRLKAKRDVAIGRHGVAAGSVNASRVVDALIILGFNALKERVAISAEEKKSNRKKDSGNGHAGQIAKKPVVAETRQVVAV